MGANENKVIDWYVKADKEGTYQINSVVDAVMNPVQINVQETFYAELETAPFEHEGLSLSIMPERSAYYGEKYYVQFQLSNNASRSFYQVKANFGKYQNAKRSVHVETVQDGSVIDTDITNQEVDYYVPSVNAGYAVPILMEGDTITIGELKPGESICGTYVCTYTGGDETHYGKLVNAFVKKMQDSNADINVELAPITGHISKEQIILPPPVSNDSEDENNASSSGDTGGSGGSSGSGGLGGAGGSGSSGGGKGGPNTSADSEDPINIMRGAFHTENRLMSMAGVRDIYFDMNYDSTMTDAEGDLGYGWYHNYESYIEDKNGFIQVYFNPQTSMSFMSKNAKEMVVQGVYEDGRITVLPSDTDTQEYVPVSDGFPGYTLVKNQDGYSLTLPDGSTYQYDLEGVFTKTINLYGQSISILYEGQAMTLQDDATGKQLVITKNDKGYIENVTDCAGNQVRFTYNEAGDLATVTNKRGFTTSYSYDDKHKIVQGVDADNQVFLINTYDEQGRVLTQDDGREDTKLVTLSYVDDEETGLTTVTLKNRNGGTQTIVANAAGDGVRVTNSIGGVTKDDLEEDLLTECV